MHSFWEVTDGGCDRNMLLRHGLEVSLIPNRREEEGASTPGESRRLAGWTRFFGGGENCGYVTREGCDDDAGDVA